ncbi:tetratricopeptide repeat protein [uncultured Gimesia sp.]|uniref:tetratricopeptide repeat protein n=1 Tax=uncultured Gimesia sp. TaxID=1678688 RepID=UPI00262BC766|nr:tetratricopeptide repeat protein [uncultured Gimesia sp.]
MVDSIFIIFGVVFLVGYLFLVLRWIYRLPRSFSIPRLFSNRIVKQGDRLLHRGDYDSAIAKYSQVIARHPKQVDAYLGRSHAYIRVNELDKALSDCNTIILLQPDNHFAFLNRGAIYALNENHQQSVVETTHGLELQPTFLDGLFNRACSYSKLGKTEEALADFAKAIQLSPTDIYNYIERGNLYIEIKQFTNAIDDYSRAMELGYQSADIFVSRGFALERIGNTRQSKCDYLNAVLQKPYDDLIQQNQNEASHYFDRGFLYTGAGLYPKAIDDYTRAFELGDQSAELLTTRGYTYLKMEAFEKAQADFEHAIQSDAEARNAINCLAWLLATCPVPEYRDGNKALQLALRNCELADTTEWNDLGTLAAAYAEVGQFDEAIRWINESSTKAPELELHRCEAQLKCFEKQKPYTDHGTES